MTTATEGIFTPIRVGTMSLGHRLVVPPHSGGGGALLGTEEQFERMCRYWLARVEGGMQWVGGGPVFVRNPLIPGFEPSGIGANAEGFFRHPSFTDRTGRLMARLHSAGGFGTVQMVLQGGMPNAPSQTLSGYLDHAIPHRLDLDEISWLVREYAESAALAAEAGADVIELHSNHDDVLQWFLSPRTNRRDDRYGGGIEGRRRIVREVCEAIRGRVARPVTLGLRLCLDERIDGGYGVPESVSLRFGAKVPGHEFRLRKASMDFAYSQGYGESRDDAYERVILDALIGDATLFIRADEVARSWRIVDPLLACWEQAPDPIPLYHAGTWGPQEATQLIQRDGRQWRNL